MEKEKAVTTAEVLEWALVSYLSSHPNDAEALEKVREDADKDVQAERARELPIVDQAREVAAVMGLLGEVESVMEESDSLALALGAEPMFEVSDRPENVVEERPVRAMHMN